jgi:hypothetical protein
MGSTIVVDLVDVGFCAAVGLDANCALLIQ